MSPITVEYPPHNARWYTEEHIYAQSLLRDVPLFSEVPAHHLRELARTALYLSFAAGETIIREGEFGATLHVIRSGRVEVVRDKGPDGRVVLASLGPGEFFGELSLFDAGPRSATVIATEDTETVVLSHAAVLQLVQRHPEVATAFLKALCRRLRTVDNRLENAARTQDPTASSDQP